MTSNKYLFHLDVFKILLFFRIIFRNEPKINRYFYSILFDLFLTKIREKYKEPVFGLTNIYTRTSGM